MIKRVIWIAAALAVIAVGVAGWRFLAAVGAFQDVTPHFAGTCEEIRGVAGAEDAALDRRTGRVILSATDRRACSPDGASSGCAEADQGRDAAAGTPGRGGLYVLDLAPGGVQRLVNVTPDTPADFHPHGLSLFRKDPDSALRVFVINHPAAGGHTVEVFEEGSDPGRLRHVETIRDPGLMSPNDLVAVGEHEFYFTNDLGAEPGLGRMLEFLLLRPLGSVQYYDGLAGRQVSEGYRFANGINVSADGARIYVADMLGRQLRVFARDAGSGDLIPRRSIALPTAPDNIAVAADGALWVAGHPRLLDFLSHAGDPEALSPSQVFRVNPASGAAEEIFADSGGRISGASVAVPVNGRMVIGAVFEPHILLCELP